MKPAVRKFAYFFCVMRILVCIIGIVIATPLFFSLMRKETAFLSSYVISIIVFLGALAILIFGIYMGIKDIREIRSQAVEENRNKKDKIEF